MLIFSWLIFLKNISMIKLMIKLKLMLSCLNMVANMVNWTMVGLSNVKVDRRSHFTAHAHKYYFAFTLWSVTFSMKTCDVINSKSNPSHLIDLREWRKRDSANSLVFRKLWMSIMVSMMANSVNHWTSYNILRILSVFQISFTINTQKYYAVDRAVNPELIKCTITTFYPGI